MSETMKYRTIKDNYGKVGVVFPRQTVNAGDDGNETPYVPRGLDELIPKRGYDQPVIKEVRQPNQPNSDKGAYTPPTLSDIYKGVK